MTRGSIRVDSFNFGDLPALALLIGILQPPVVAFLKQDHWKKWINTAIAVVFSIVAGIVAVAIKGDLDVSNVFGTILVVYVAASAAYAGFWNPTGVDAKIKTATSYKGKSSPAVGK